MILAMHDAPTTWRLLIVGHDGEGHGATASGLDAARLDGAANMALDQALLDAMEAQLAAGKRLPPPVLRLYGWEPVAVSIGRHQAMERACDLDACLAHGVDVVRRPTGGRAVLHDDELTYAVVAPATGRFGGTGVTQASEAIASALLLGLRRLGIEASKERGRPGTTPREGACFASASRSEIVADSRKLCGSAQRRSRAAVLQHGSLPLAFDVDRQALLLGSERAALSDRVASVASCLPAVAAIADVAVAIVGGFQAEFGVRLEPSELDPPERARWSEVATSLRADPERWRSLSGERAIACR